MKKKGFQRGMKKSKKRSKINPDPNIGQKANLNVNKDINQDVHQEYTCEICYEEKKSDGREIRGPDNHCIGTDCAGGYIKDIFSDPEKNLPPKGRIGGKDVDSNVVSLYMDNKQINLFNEITIKKVKQEKIVHGPNGDYYEIWDDDKDSNFLSCGNPRGRVISGINCLEKIEDPHNDDLEANIPFQVKINKHLNCKKFLKMKEEWEAAVDTGNKRKCPYNGGIGGIKDDACTHITCK